MKNKQLILIVEDDLVNRKILGKILVDSYDIIEADNGAAAWEIISEKSEEISAVLLDINMPVMDGYELLEKIRESRLENLPIIITTTSTDEESEQRALECGAWDFVAKPYNIKILTSRLKNAIARSKLAAYDKMKYMSEHDELTGLYNRSKMFSETRKMLDQHKDMKFAFIRIDIDRFALFNTSFGEIEGDRLLIYMSECIKQSTESFRFSTFGRMNADVFCVCISCDYDKTEFEEKAEYIQQRLTEYRNDYRIEMSIGVCIIDDNSLGIDDFYFRASIASQKCKNQIDTHIAYYDTTVGNRISNELAIENEMHAALNDCQFVVYLQPKFRLSTESACGAEALTRWIHPTKGLIPPNDFIPVFERNGFISKLDYYVWEEVCKLLREWIDKGVTPFPVSVNVSRISLYNPQLSEVMSRLVEKYGLSPSLLQLEITESAYMTDPELMEDTIDSLHDAGFTILMDDFGSSYSSLNTLKRIKVDILKIDMKFLPVKDEIERGEIILTSVIKMANWLGMSVVVEGVETRQQRDFLEGVGCDCVQGFFYSKPIPRAEYEEKYVFVQNDNAVDDMDDFQDEITPLHNMTILVIDDSEIDRVILKENLQEFYHVKLCESAEEGFAYLRRNVNKVRLIIVDNIMSGMSGMEFIRYCRQDGLLKSIPQIMITANDTVEDQVEAFNEGAYDFITKPFAKEIILARINNIMKISQRSSLFDTVEQQYKKASEVDPETGLLNKMTFRELGTEVIETFPEDKAALFVLDIDDFAQINEKYGFAVGNEVIKEIADELTDAFRKTDIIGRIGGDKFVSFMSKITNLQTAKSKAGEIIKAISFRCRKRLHLEISVSIGISSLDVGDTIDTLFARADQALYEAKNTGKSKSVLYGEKVPPVLDDGKPVVLICSTDPTLYPAIALSYGNDAAFLNITSLDELVAAYEKYNDRINAVCLDIKKKRTANADRFYDFIAAHGGGNEIPIIVVCKDGDMEQLRDAVGLKLYNIFTFPLEPDTVQKRLSQAIVDSISKKK